MPKKPPFRTKAPKKKSNSTAKKETYKGQVYLSKLEAYCAKKLDEAGLEGNYEQVSFTVSPAFTCPATCVEYSFKTDKKTKVKSKVFQECKPKILAITYKPDFTNLTEGWIIEVKGYKNEAFPLRLKLFKRYLHEQNLAIRFYMPNDQEQVDATIADILKHKNT